MFMGTNVFAFKRALAPDRKSTTSELQARQYLVCLLLLEKKKNNVGFPGTPAVPWKRTSAPGSSRTDIISRSLMALELPPDFSSTRHARLVRVWRWAHAS